MDFAENSNNKIFKFIRNKNFNSDSLKFHKENFIFQKEIKYGYPCKPTAFDYDNKLNIFSIGTNQGEIRIYGKPGVEFYGQLENNSRVVKLVFIPGEGQLITLSEDNFFYLWEIHSSLKKIRSISVDETIKTITSLCLSPNKIDLLIGTNGAEIYNLSLSIFKFQKEEIFQQNSFKTLINNIKQNPGSVKSIVFKPHNNSSKILIGYSKGLLIIWDIKEKNVDYASVTKDIESTTWRSDGNEFISSHTDGTYCIWTVKNNFSIDIKNPYGPYPCKPIKKIDWLYNKSMSCIAFIGGMPRATHSDKFTVSLLLQHTHTTFDVSSKVVDFKLLYSDGHQANNLIIIAEEEIIFLDITKRNMPSIPLPYLNCVHSSAVTCLAHVSDVCSDVYKIICRDIESNYDSWPIDGGMINDLKNDNDILITGHEDGSVKLWSCGGVILNFIAEIKTNKFFITEDLDSTFEFEEEEEEWPPFRKIGEFDPYSDDPRLAIKKVTLCPVSGKLIIGGTAGQVMLFELSNNHMDVNLIQSSLINENEGFIWKGHSSLKPNLNDLSVVPGPYKLNQLIQVYPPTCISSIEISTPEWDLVAVGTALGFIVVDVGAKTIAINKCTVNIKENISRNDSLISRRMSMKKSLRESFRRIRKRRSQTKKKSSFSEYIPDESKPVERQIEARSVCQSGYNSIIKCFHFSNCFLVNAKEKSPTLWAGTNNGQILVYLLNLPSKNVSSESAIGCLAKEIQLKHKAPVINIEIYQNSSKSKDVIQKLIISTEEQFKSFILPSLKPTNKLKVTAQDGSRLKNLKVSKYFAKASLDSYKSFTCITNQGDLIIYTLPEFKKIYQVRCVKKEDIIAISTLIFSPKGEAFYMCSPSEIQRVTLNSDNLKNSGLINGIKKDKRYTTDRTIENSEETIKIIETLSSQMINATRDENELVNISISNVKNSNSININENINSFETNADITVDSVKDHIS